MTIPTISTLPTAPARTDAPATFITRADAFLAAIVTMQSELNTSIGAMNTDIAGVNADATAAAASASAAATSESNASTSETNAATSESNAASSAAAAASSYDQFDDRYLGSKASDPAVDNDGNALLTGALYFNTTSDDMKVYTGSTWKVTGFNPDSPTFTDTVTAPSFDINSIAETKAETAVDVFVYDTRKDSDGGAWRKRTQHTSWYNETLDTATRGSRREFPAVAVIVAEVDQLTIYDGDDPSLPMWALWTQFNAPLQSLTWWRFIRDATSVSALNGIVAFGQDINADTASGLSFIDFNKDIVGRYCFSATQGGIGMDASSGTKEENLVAGSLGVIVNNAVNDVAMTVLPNAPIDAATGLPVPTIAVSTDGGISVIKDDGTVVDSNATADFAGINFGNDGDMWAVDKGFADEIRYYEGVAQLSDNFDHDLTYWGGSTPSSQQGLPVPWWNGSTSYIYNYIARTDYGIAAQQHNEGVFFLNPKYTDRFGIGAYVTSTYNTGWMNGDIKLATLSDTDDTDVTGSELVTNGDMSSDTGWSLGAGWSIGSGILTASSAATGTNARTEISTIAGKTYIANIDCLTKTQGTIRLYWHDGTYQNFVNLVAGETATLQFTASGTSGTLRVYAFGTSSGTFDNLTCRIAEEDRSVNDNGLQVFGTITKTPVATGADLVDYRGWNASQYLFQPYNSDFQFGTDNFSVIYWVKTSDNYATIIDNRSADNVTGWGLFTTAFGSSSRLYFIFAGGQAQSIETPQIVNDTWTHITAQRVGSVVQFYVNGELVHTDSSTDWSTVGISKADTAGARIGVRNDGSQNLTGSLALFRISATAPTAEQIAKIYEDEKVLFQENAQATLYGTDDYVRALAYDDSTQLLHAGTIQGRSVFQGLRRVDNTTAGITAAISASNGLVAED